jgi:alpha-galactosidase
LRRPDGRLANAGYNWFRWCYGLDPTHPAVREHVRRLITTAVREWGFPYLKLDFLYAAALPARRYDIGLTGAQAMRQAPGDLREAAGPDTFLLGCGCPLGSAVGIVDGMRIKADVAPDWHPQLFTPRLAPLLRREKDFVSARNAIRNTINRAPLHARWWLNAPDCLLVRDRDTRLNEAEVRLASVIALSGGNLLVSDDMSRLRPERRRDLPALLPVLGASARAPGWLEYEMPDLLILPLRGAGDLGNWLVAGVFNWDDTPRERVLSLDPRGLDPTQEHCVSEFWDAERWFLRTGQPLRLKAIPPHGVQLLAIRKRREAVPLLRGSTFHFSQGGEVKEWAVSDRQVRARLELGRLAEGELELALPAAARTAALDHQPLTPLDLGDNIYRLAFTVDQAQTLLVSC